MMKLILVVLCVVAASLSVPTEFDEWANFKAKHGKTYKSLEEEQYRLGVYLSNKKLIEDHNAKYKAGLYSYDLKMNHFGDKLPQEISAFLNGFNRSGEATHRRHGLKFNITSNSKVPRVPSSFDWREKGAVTPVKDQGECNSGWAFSATGSLEGQMFFKTGKLVSFSEQNLIDCSKSNNGCDGGSMAKAFLDIKSNGGIDTEDSYPYEGKTNSTCRYSSSDSAATVSDLGGNLPGFEEFMDSQLFSVGPMSIGINVLEDKLPFYNSGIFRDDRCTPDRLNHGALLVGYGSENGHEYWLIKNSWGANWGEEGYFRLAKNARNMCGVASSVTFPIVGRI